MTKNLLLTLCGAVACWAIAEEETCTWGGRAVHPAVVNSVTGQNAEDVLSLRGDWEFTTNVRYVPKRNGIWGRQVDEEWKDVRSIRVPSCWEAQGVGEPGPSECWDPGWDHAAKPIRHKHMGSGWYRKNVTVPAAWKDKRVWLKLGGVKSCAWVWVNGQQVALVENYCATEKYEITDLVTPGSNACIVLEVSNARPSRKGLMSNVHKWGGIYRDIELEATPKAFIDDAWVSGDFDKRLAEVHVEVGGEVEKWRGGKVRVTVEGETVESKIKQSNNPNNQTIAEVPFFNSNSTLQLEVPLRHFRPWSPEHPNLYTAKVELVENGRVIQTRCERFGVRKIEVVGKEFRLNGKPVFLRGFGDDFVYPLTGMSPADRDVHRRNLAKARAAGFNYARLHTHCELPEYFEAADELGVMLQVELPYYSDGTTEGFSFDPKRDVTELYRHYRRHPSFVTYSMGNEGSFGNAMDVQLHQYVKRMDPDRLKISHDANILRLTTPDRSDYDGGPIKPWEPGTFKAERPFVCHEYLNLCVKTDSRTEGRYTGVWQPPVSRAARGDWLARFGLGQEWGDRLQDAQHALQAVWQKRGIESARADAGCGGYHFWTITDVVVWNEAVESYSAQGLFNPFWEEKSRGQTAERFARFNSPSCVLVDFAPSNCVFTSGEHFSAEVKFAHFGEAPMREAKMRWVLKTAAGELASGERPVGTVELGPARALGRVELSVPAVEKPVKASFVVSVGDVSNDWDLWIFPKGPSHAEVVSAARSRGVTIAPKDSPEAKDALARGAKLITVDGADGRPNISLGWWWMGSQVGTAIREHPALGDFPHDGVMTPLWFRLIKDTGLPLPAMGVGAEDLIVVGEGGSACYAYLTERRIGNSKILECHGLDLLSDLPEGNALLAALVGYLASDLCVDGKSCSQKEKWGPRGTWYQDAKLGAFVHWGLYAIPGQGEWIMSRNGLPAEEYARLAERWNPEEGAEEQWVVTAKRMGAKYMVFTTRHHDGFSLFDSKFNAFNSMNAPAKRDHVRAFAEACRKHGLRVGFYYSLVDWRYEKTDRPKMKRQVFAELEQLMSEYGKVDVLWYDGGWLPKDVKGEKADFWNARELNAKIRGWQPDILINDRAGTKEDFQTVEGRNIPRPPKGARLWEACLTLQDDDWSFWGHCNHTAFRKTPEQIVCQLLHCLEVGGNLLVNLGPAADGSVDAWQRDLCEKVGAWVKRHADAIYGTRATDVATNYPISRGWTGNACGFFTEKADRHYLYFHAWPGTETSFPVFKREVKRVTLDGKSVDFTWKPEMKRLELRGLPAKAPDAVCTVLEIE